MQLNPTLAVFLTPDKRTLTYAFKGVLAMTCALFIAMYMNLDRPYWAVISAVFLQIRPESGMVIEKAICQIVGTLIGGLFGIIILNLFSAEPLLALGSLAIWLGVNSGLSAMLRRVNFIYAFAMACVTPCVIILLVMVQPQTVSSAQIFNLAQARIEEIIVGVLCATFASVFFWPVRVQQGLRQHARHVINQTLDYLAVELDPNGSHQKRHEDIDSVLEALVALNDDSSAVIYEGPEGPGRSRAATLICNKVLSLVAVIQIFGRLQRNHAQLISGSLQQLLDNLRTDLQRIADSKDFYHCYQLAQAQRRTLLHSTTGEPAASPLEARLRKTALEMVTDLVSVLRAFNALENSDHSLLKAPALRPHRDPLIGITTGLRTALVFTTGAIIWYHTASTSALMLIILPMVFSIMMARLPLSLLMMVLRRLLIGVIIAIPVSIFCVLGPLAQSSGDFELLAMFLGAAFFVGLMALGNRPTMPYGIGYCVPLVILVHPANDMSYAFSIDNTLSNALAIFAGVSILYWIFKIVRGPSVQLMQFRLLTATKQDIINIAKHENPTDWFNARMGDRLLRLANYDKGAGNAARGLTDLGLTGLNIGHGVVRLRHAIQNLIDDEVEQYLQTWQEALADAFMCCSRGQLSDKFHPACSALMRALEQKDNADADQLKMIEGMFERLALTFERTAETIRNKPEGIAAAE